MICALVSTNETGEWISLQYFWLSVLSICALLCGSARRDGQPETAIGGIFCCGGFVSTRRFFHQASEEKILIQAAAQPKPLQCLLHCIAPLNLGAVG